jgi:hypothetical protein
MVRDMTVGSLLTDSQLAIELQIHCSQAQQAVDRSNI